MSTFANPRANDSSLPKDKSGKLVETVSLINWRPQRQTVTNAAWHLLGDGEDRTSMLLKNNGSFDVILAPDNQNYSNDPTQANAGFTLGAGKTIEPTFAKALNIYARVVPGGTDCQIEVVEAF